MTKKDEIKRLDNKIGTMFIVSISIILIVTFFMYMAMLGIAFNQQGEWECVEWEEELYDVWCYSVPYGNHLSISGCGRIPVAVDCVSEAMKNPEISKCIEGTLKVDKFSDNKCIKEQLVREVKP